MSLAAAVAIMACAGTAGAHTAPGLVVGGAVAAAPDDASMIKARTRFFGAANVDPRTGAVATVSDVDGSARMLTRSVPRCRAKAGR